MVMRPLSLMVRVLTVLAVMSVLGSCASSRPVAETAPAQRVYFPQPPDPPRLQFLVSFNRAGVWAGQHKEKSSLSQWIVGEEPATTSMPDRIDTPYGIDAYNGRLYVCDVGLDRVHIIDANTGEYGLLGSPDAMKNPVNITIDRRDGTKYVCDSQRRMVLVFDANDRLVREFGDPKTLIPMDVAIDGQELLIADLLDAQVEIWSKDGKFLRAIGRKGVGPDELEQPTNLEMDAQGRIYVTDTLGQQVKIFDRKGSFQGSIGVPGDRIGAFARPKGIAIDPHGYVYVVDAQWGVVQIFAADDRLLLIVSGQGGAAPGLILPAAIAIDRTSLPAFAKYLDPRFEAEYLVFLVNQYGKNKVAVYAYGRSKDISPDRYEVDLSKLAPATKPQ